MVTSEHQIENRLVWFTSIRSELVNQRIEAVNAVFVQRPRNDAHYHVKPLKVNIMSIKNQTTKADYIEWDEMNKVVLLLERDGRYLWARLIKLGCHFGLRISDLSKLTWEQVYERESFDLIEDKTKKRRKVDIHSDVKTLLEEHYQEENCPNITSYLFASPSTGKPYSRQHINREIKKIFKKYRQGKGLQITTHSLRKTFGRRYAELSNFSEYSIRKLSEVFQHSCVSVTKIYLGLRQEELQEVYLSL